MSSEVMTSTVVWLNIYCLLNEYEPFKYYVEVSSRNIIYYVYHAKF